MVVSYIGTTDPLMIVNNAIKSRISLYRRQHKLITPPLTLGGIFGSDVTACAEFAASNDMAVYLSAKDIIDKSDVILSFLPDGAIRTLSRDLRGHGIKNKIFCHFSPAFDASVLEFDSSNTYISFYISVYEHESDKVIPHHLMIEGYGPRFEEVCYTLRMLDITFIRLTPEEKSVYLIAANMLSGLSNLIEKSARRLMQYSLYTKPELVDIILEQCKKSGYSMNSYSPVKSGNVRFVENQSDILDSLGLDDITSLYGSLLMAESRNLDNGAPAFSHIMDVAKNMIDT